MYRRNRILVLALAAIPFASSAATICVNPGGTNGCFPTIASALAAAAPAGDTISVAAGTYHEGDLVMSKSVDIAGAGPGLTVVDATGIGGNVFRFLAFGGATSTLSGMTIQHGQRGVDVNGGNTVTLSHVHITQNGPWTGAGVVNNTSVVRIDSSLIDYNYATDEGNIAGCDWGGASGGGYAALCGGGTAVITNSTIANNTAGRWGGGLLLSAGPTTIENTTISGNSANFNGTGLAGSAIFAGAGTDLRYVTIANNTSAGAGGGAIWGDSVSLYASLVQKNVNGDCMTGSHVASHGYNLASDGSCPFIAVGDEQNVDVQLQPLADNGGDTPTMALPATSPAVDRIPADQCAETRDQDGVARPQHGACDVGAFERVWTTQDLAALLLSQVTGSADTATFIGKFSTIVSQVLNGHPGLACQVLPNFSSQLENLAAHGKIDPATAAAIAQSVKDIEASVGC
ncbi:MAG TPA: choice-of-anchor Q domain-containing protein [Usitatibacter sp.]|jgi:hypothetical protein|nr:choice-of-anchor Q domain-containing protein [Usitatibacter sp.]